MASDFHNGIINHKIIPKLKIKYRRKSLCTSKRNSNCVSKYENDDLGGISNCENMNTAYFPFIKSKFIDHKYSCGKTQ